MSTLTVAPLSDAVFAALNQNSLTNLTGGTAPSDTDVPQGRNLPYCWFVVNEENARGFGTGTLNRHGLTVHAAAVGSSTMGPAKQLQGILDAATALLKDATLTITGFRAAGKVFYDSTSEPVVSEIGGKPCWEAAANFYLYVEL